MAFLLKGGRVIDPGSGVDGIADVLIQGDVITATGDDLECPGDTQVIDCSGMIVTPGFIDAHTHLREPGREDEETVATAARAAALGGFTTVVAMPNTDPVADKGAVIRLVRERGAAAGFARVEAVGAISKGLAGKELSEFEELSSAGAVGLSDDGRGVADPRLMRNALSYARLVGAPLLLHAEDPSLSDGGHMHEGETSFRLGLTGIPSSAEEIMVARDIRLAANGSTAIHIQHVSSAGTVELVREAKSRGAAVTCEVTPHHLALTDACLAGEGGYEPFDTNLKVNPPIRSQADRVALLEGLKDGTIDMIATDHAPHAAHEKEEDFESAPCGAIGLQTALGVVLSELVEPGHLSLVDAIAALTVAPAKLFGLDRGTLTTGAPADVTVFDPGASWIVTSGQLASKSKNSPFLGRELPGRVLHVFVGGDPVVNDGKATVR